MNSRRAGAAEAGNGTVLNAAGGHLERLRGSFIFASNQGAGDTGGWGHLSPIAGTFNKQASVHRVRTAFINTGTTNVNAGTMQVTSAFTNNGLINAAAGAIFLGSNAAFVNAGTLAGNGTFATHINGDIVNQVS